MAEEEEGVLYMDCQVTIVVFSLVLVSICCIVWLGKEFVKLLQWMVKRALEEEEDEKD